MNYDNKFLKKCRWSKDPCKKIKQLNYFYNNLNRFGIDFADSIRLNADRKSCYNDIKNRR